LLERVPDMTQKIKAWNLIYGGMQILIGKSRMLKS